MTTHTCPVCTAATSVSFTVERIGRFQQCDSCGFIFAPETPSEDAALYDENFGATNINPTYRKTATGCVIKNREKLIREAAALAWPACLPVTSPKRTRWQSNSLSTSEPQARSSLTMFLRWRDTFYTAWFNAIGCNCPEGELA